MAFHDKKGHCHFAAEQVPARKGVRRLDRVLIISSNEKSLTAILQLIAAESVSVTDTADSAAKGRQMAAETAYQTILINAPLKDAAADSLAIELAKMTGAGIMLFVSSEAERETEEKVMSYGVFVLSKPVSKAWFYKALHLLEAAEYRTRNIQHENQRLQQQINETKIINRAKGVLMEYLSMTEPQAHKYLEKQAMDLRISKLEVAKRLISTYEY